ncbi:MAG: lysylphosphatidylglycerol synthase transmembrane domain-containing protein [Bacteroides sp.]|nr:lysylphosphatidylglycerol synthase transmembrane domain-containing protein [Bacteroides sp.]
MIFLALGLLLLWWVTRGQDLDKIMEEFRNANYFWILMAMVAGIFSHVARAMRWNILIRSMGFKVGLGNTFHAVMSGYLANLVVPRLGEVSKCAVLSKSNGIPFNSLAGTMIAERFVDLITLILLMFFTIVFQFHFLKDFLYNFFFGPLLERGTSSLVIVMIAGGVSLILTIGFFWWLRSKLRDAEPESFGYKLRRQLRGFVNGIKTLWRMRRKGWFLFYSLVIWGLYFLNAYLSFFAIEATSHLSPVAGITLLAVGSLGILAPVPGGIGTYHFITIATLTQLYHIASEPATSYAYITHAGQMILIIGTSAILWFIFTVRKKGAAETQIPDVI